MADCTSVSSPSQYPGPNPSGLCMCGCGRSTSIAMQTKKKEGNVKGYPVRYLPGHARTKLTGRSVFTLDTGYHVNEITGCWIWHGGVDARGYAKIDGRHAHTAMWENQTGKRIPDGMALHHICENKQCVNPAHLECVSQKYHARHHAERYGGGKLTWEKVSHIRLFAERGMKRRHLAAMYQVDKTTISEVIRRETWA